MLLQVATLIAKNYTAHIYMRSCLFLAVCAAAYFMLLLYYYYYYYYYRWKKDSKISFTNWLPQKSLKYDKMGKAKLVCSNCDEGSGCGMGVWSGILTASDI